ncbi:hypothetical protein IMCC21906_02081 [Spongiibacter sp. IMCC21906]|jgi:uncharacterized protein YcgL (UPF0745 family)|uniref:YcgL domain-containing protein n=1 Tax=Spongiibacter sp. IMCC21906 TaxID=1620392 RepID=UPI00062DE420|nr:YcgL domain-containing protein [Spongiibacter sp. IMCC21906]AKH69751.1 hypothetical protein IMCC21906_02081 [Spongiibacter sp. IMCC21906]
MKRVCAIYRSKRHDGMYLYVDKQEALGRVPEELLRRFGQAEFSMTLLLHPERRLARADVSKVMAAITDNGFYLQLPPEPFSNEVRSPE